MDKRGKMNNDVRVLDQFAHTNAVAYVAADADDPGLSGWPRASQRGDRVPLLDENARELAPDETTAARQCPTRHVISQLRR